jgi:hypothetical protein
LYEQLLRVQIPKAQKYTVKLSVFFALLGSGCIKADCKMFMKFTPVVNITNISQAALSLYSFAKKLQVQTVDGDKLRKTLSTKKFLVKCG